MNNFNLLEKVLDVIYPNVTQTTFNTFIKPVVLREVSENPKTAFLETKDSFYANILNNRYLHLFEEAFKDVTGSDYKISISFKGNKEARNKPSFNATSKKNIENIKINAGGYAKEKFFNPNNSFENFVVGESNKFAHAACFAVAKAPSTQYNPLFLYGGSGLGKTHLMNAIGIYIQYKMPEKRILYVEAETFTNDFIKSLQDGKTREFKLKYRKTDVLLIDDIQFLEKKEAIQEEFFYTFNALYDEKKQIILSSDRSPSKLINLDERLRSRFSWNMLVEISKPDYETRVAILRKKAENMNVLIDEDMENIISLISEKITDNIRELEGAFVRINYFANIMNEKPQLSFAKRILKDVIQNGNNSVTPEKIKKAVSKKYKIKISDLESSSRKAVYAYPRQIAMYLCRIMTDYSFTKIGNIFGNRHFTTVKHACEKIEYDVKHDRELKEKLDEIKEEINK